MMPARSLTGSTAGPMIDTEVILPNGGRVYVTPLEGWEIVVKDPGYDSQIGTRAATLGWASPDACAALRDRIADLEEQLAYAQAGQPKVVSLEDALTLASAATAA